MPAVELPTGIGRLFCCGLLATAALTASSAHGQTREGGDIGASSRSVIQNSLQPAPAQTSPPRAVVRTGTSSGSASVQPDALPPAAPQGSLQAGQTAPPTPGQTARPPASTPNSRQPAAAQTASQPASAPTSRQPAAAQATRGPAAEPANPQPAPTPASMPPLRLSGPAQGLPPLRLSGTNKAPAYPLPPAGAVPADPAPPGDSAADATPAAGKTAALSHLVVPANPAPGTPAALLPPPSSYLSSAWNVWPQAWAYVPTLWNSWYHDLVQQSRPATPAERVGTETSLATRPDQPEATPTAPVVTTPPTRITDDASLVLPAPRLVRRRRYNLVISGAGILAATWAADRLLGNSLSPKPETWLPLVGPWILLDQQSAMAAPNSQVQVLLVIDGLLQAGGLSMALLGFILTTKQYVVTVDPMRSDLAPPKAQ